LITNHSSNFSIHRSTQEICLAYLTEFLKLNKEDPRLKGITNAFDDYLDQTIEQEDFSKMKVLAQHGEKFLSHQDLLTDFSRGLLESKLGSIYYFTNNNQIKEVSDASFKILEKESLGQNSFENSSRLARSFLHLATIYTECEIAIRIYSQDRKNNGNLAWALSHLGNIHRRLGDYEKARIYLEKSIDLNKQYKMDKKRLARTLAYLGSVYRGLGFYQKSIDALEESLAIYHKDYSRDHFRIGWTLIRLGNVYSDLGGFKKAKQYFEEGLFISKKYFPEDHMSMALTLTYLGNCYRELGEYEKSRAILEQSLKIHQKHFDKKYRRMGWVLFHLATTYKALGDDQKAQQLYDRVLEIYTNYCDDDGIETAGILRNMGKVCLDKNRFADAEDWAKRSLKILQSRHHVDSYRTLEFLGDIYLKKAVYSHHIKSKTEVQKLKTKARDLFVQALKIAEQNFPKNSVHIERIKLRIRNM